MRTGFTTGACAQAGVRACLDALVTGIWAEKVRIRLPNGRNADFSLKSYESGMRGGLPWALASIIKDGGVARGEDDGHIPPGLSLEIFQSRNDLGNIVRDKKETRPEGKPSRQTFNMAPPSAKETASSQKPGEGRPVRVGTLRFHANNVDDRPAIHPRSLPGRSALHGNSPGEFPSPGDGEKSFSSA